MSDKCKHFSRPCDRLCVVVDHPTIYVINYLRSLPVNVLSAIHRAFSEYLKTFSVAPGSTVCEFADDLRYWKVSTFSWEICSSGISVHFTFQSFLKLGL